MAALLANIDNTATANVLQIINRHHPEAAIGFKGQSIVIRLCYLHVSLKYRRKLLKSREYGNPVGKYWQHCNRKCSSDYLQTSPRGYNRVLRSKYSDKAVLFTCFFKISQKISENSRIWQPCWQILATLQSQMFFRLSTDLTPKLQ